MDRHKLIAVRFQELGQESPNARARSETCPRKEWARREQETFPPNSWPCPFGLFGVRSTHHTGETESLQRPRSHGLSIERILVDPVETPVHQEEVRLRAPAEAGGGTSGRPSSPARRGRRPSAPRTSALSSTAGSSLCQGERLRSVSILRPSRARVVHQLDGDRSGMIEDHATPSWAVGNQRRVRLPVHHELFHVPDAEIRRLGGKVAERFATVIGTLERIRDE